MRRYRSEYGAPVCGFVPSLFAILGAELWCARYGLVVSECPACADAAAPELPVSRDLFMVYFWSCALGLGR